MLNFRSLYSGSSGNSLLVQTEHTNLLIDAGVSSKKIESARQIGKEFALNNNESFFVKLNELR